MSSKGILKGVGQTVTGIAAVVAIFAVTIFFYLVFFKGAFYLSTTVEPFLSKLAYPVFFLCLFVLLPLSFFQKTKTVGLGGLVISSFFFGLLAWLLGFIATLYYLGPFWVFVGLFIAGIGVVPIGIIAAFFHHQADLAWSLITLIVLAYGIRVFAIWYEERGSDEYIDLPSDNVIDVEGSAMPSRSKKISAESGHYPKPVEHKIPDRRKRIDI